MTDAITLPRSVVEQALKALEKSDRISGYRNNRAAVNSLIAALEQPPVVEQPQGTRHETAIPDKLASQAIDALASYCNTGEIEGADDLLASLLYSIEHSQQPQVEQEPVAWVDLECWKAGTHDAHDVFSGEQYYGWTPLYTCPQPKREPLTDEEIDRIALDHMNLDRGTYAYVMVFKVARAIEAAHGIKEQK